MRRAGQWLFATVVLVAIAAPWLAPNPPDRRYPGSQYAPPTRIQVFHEGLRTPFIHPQRLVSALERRFEQDTSRRASLRWLSDGHLVTVPENAGGPLLLLGADSLGRDTFSRLVYSARTSLALAVISTVAALLIGAVVGGAAGYAGGLIDHALSRFTDFVLVLPAIYVALALMTLWCLSFAVVTPMRQAYINGLIPSQQRATVLSFDALIGSSGGVVAQPALGRIADVYGYGTSYVVAAGIQLLAVPFAVLARRENAPSDPITESPEQPEAA